MFNELWKCPDNSPASTSYIVRVSFYFYFQYIYIFKNCSALFAVAMTSNFSFPHEIVLFCSPYRERL